jgi:hypothetical protein
MLYACVQRPKSGDETERAWGMRVKVHMRGRGPGPGGQGVGGNDSGQRQRLRQLLTRPQGLPLAAPAALG